MIIIIKMIRMIIRHRLPRGGVRILWRSVVAVSSVTSRTDRSKNRPRQNDLFVNYIMTVKGSALAYTRVAPSELFSSLLGLYLPMKLPSSSIPASPMPSA